MSASPSYSIPWAQDIFERLREKYARATEEVLKKTTWTKSAAVWALCNYQPGWEHFKRTVKRQHLRWILQNRELDRERLDQQILLPGR